MADPITIKCPNHHQMLTSGLWNFFQSGRGVDYDVQWGGRTIRAHRLILELFLMPKLIASSAGEQQQPKDSLDIILEFAYKGEVTVDRGQLNDVLHAAEDCGFQMLVEVIESIAAKQIEMNNNINTGALFPSAQTFCDQPITESVLAEKLIKIEQKPVIAIPQTIRPCYVSLEKITMPIPKNVLRNVSKSGEEQFPNDITLHSGGSDRNEDKLASRPSQGDTRSGIKFDEGGSICQPSPSPMVAVIKVEATIDASTLVVDRASFLTEMQDDIEDGIIGSCSVDVVASQNQIKTPISSTSTLLGLEYEHCFKCRHCPKVFGKRGWLMRHYHVVHPDKKLFQCYNCPRTFAEEDDLMSHLRGHTEENSLELYRCDWCPMTFSVRRYYQNHTCPRPDENIYKCNVCNKRFKDDLMLRMHLKIHNKMKTYKCYICGIVLAQKSNFRTHFLREHFGKTLPSTSKK